MYLPNSKIIYKMNMNEILIIDNSVILSDKIIEIQLPTYSNCFLNWDIEVS